MNWSDIATGVAPVLGTVLVAVLTWLGARLASLITANIHNVYLRGVLVRADDAVITAVKEVGQIYVDELKKANVDGVLTADEKAQAKKNAVAKAKEYLGPKGLILIEQVLGLTGSALDGFLGGKVEAAVVDNKKDP